MLDQNLPFVLAVCLLVLLLFASVEPVGEQQSLCNNFFDLFLMALIKFAWLISLLLIDSPLMLVLWVPLLLLLLLLPAFDSTSSPTCDDEESSEEE